MDVVVLEIPFLIFLVCVLVGQGGVLYHFHFHSARVKAIKVFPISMRQSGIVVYVVVFLLIVIVVLLLIVVLVFDVSSLSL